MSEKAHVGRFRRLRNLTKGDGLRAQLVRGGVGSLCVKVLAMSLSLVVALVLARVLGPKGYGVYSYVFALVGLLAIPAQFGLPALVMRETAKAQAVSDWATLKGLWRWAGGVAGGLSLLLVAGGGGAAWVLAGRFTSLQINTFIWGLVLVPLFVMLRLAGGAVRGLFHVVASQFADSIVRPGLLIVFVLAVSSFGLGSGLTASRAMALHVLAAGLALFVGGILLYRVRPAINPRARARYRYRAWAVSALPLGFIAGMQLINQQTDILMLGLFTNSQQVGIYRVAVQGANFVTFGLYAVNMIVAPHCVRMYAQGEYAQLQRLVTASARVALVIALPAAMVFILFGAGLLRAVVGPGYTSGALPLAILSLGQLANVGLGLVSMLLNMTDRERTVARGVALAAGFNIMSNLALIPLWGINGAALATAFTLVLWNSLLAGKVAQHLGINSTVFYTRPVVL